MAGTHSWLCCGGWGEQEEGQETPSHPLPQLPFLHSCWTPSKAARGSPIPISHGQGWQGAGMEGRDSAPVIRRRGGGRSPPHPLEELRSAPRPPLSHPEEEARGS